MGGKSKRTVRRGRKKRRMHGRRGAGRDLMAGFFTMYYGWARAPDPRVMGKRKDEAKGGGGGCHTDTHTRTSPRASHAQGGHTAKMHQKNMHAGVGEREQAERRGNGG